MRSGARAGAASATQTATSSARRRRRRHLPRRPLTPRSVARDPGLCPRGWERGRGPRRPHSASVSAGSEAGRAGTAGVPRRTAGPPAAPGGPRGFEPRAAREASSPRRRPCPSPRRGPNVEPESHTSHDGAHETEPASIAQERGEMRDRRGGRRGGRGRGRRRAAERTLRPPGGAERRRSRGFRTHFPPQAGRPDGNSAGGAAASDRDRPPNGPPAAAQPVLGKGHHAENPF